ncbi:MAG TPA: Na+/H+ antiporter [Burkholderiaceae bacterium]
MHILEIILGLLATVAAVGALAKRVPIPLPLLQAGAGLLLSFAPGFEQVQLDPAIFFALFIPPLLFSEGWLIPKRELMQVLRPVLLLALGLVTLTVLVVGYAIHLLIPSLPLAAAFALGAIVSPTDAVAISAISHKLELPSRLTHIIGGESLINDASGLVAFKVAVAAMATGYFSFSDTGLDFLVLSFGGLACGLAVAGAIGMLRLWLVSGNISEPVIQSTLSLLTPFAAYFAAEALHVSGILAVVAGGIYAGMHDTRHLNVENRLQTWEVWRVLLFVFNGVVFLLLGLQLRGIMGGLAGYSGAQLAAYTGAVYALVLVTRMAWVYPAAYLPRWLFPHIAKREERPHGGAVFLLGWAGIRGSVTLAAALSLPVLAGGGQPFPGRDLIIFIAAGVIVLTLVVHGLTLPMLITKLGIAGDGIFEREEHMARVALANAAIKRLEPHRGEMSTPHEQAYAARLAGVYQRRVRHLDPDAPESRQIAVELKVERNIRLTALDAEREELFALNKARRINEEVLRKLQRELDHMESALIEPDKHAA